MGPPVRPGWKVGIHPGHGLRALMEGRRAPVGGSGILSSLSDSFRRPLFLPLGHPTFPRGFLFSAGFPPVQGPEAEDVMSVSAVCAF